MKKIEDRLSAASEELRRASAEVDTESALAAVTSGADGRVRPRMVAPVLVLVALVGVGTGALLLSNRDDQLVAAGGDRGATSIDDHAARRHVIDTMGDNGSGPSYIGPAFRSLDELLPNVTYEHPDGSASPMTDLVVVGRVTSVEPGLGFVVPGGDAPSGVPTEFDDPESVWRTIRLQVEVERSIGGPPAPERLEVGLAYRDQPSELELTERGLRAFGRAVFFLRSDSPVFDDTPGVHAVLRDGGFIAPVDDLGRLSLPLLDEEFADRLLSRVSHLDALVAAGEAGPRRLLVNQDSSVGDAPGGPPGPQPPGGPDLAPAQPGREITFDRIGDVRLGATLKPDEARPYDDGGPCGYWGPAEPSHDGDEPLGGLVDGTGTSSPRVVSVIARNPTYRTASGVGLGTTLAGLHRVYGEDLVVDRSDGWDRPTDGLLASYQDVAAVRNGDRALTFYLRDDAVEAVKLSDADFWGDDEGCA